MQRNLCDSCGSVFYHSLVHSYHELEEREFYDLTHVSYIKNTDLLKKLINSSALCIYRHDTHREI